ncbi:hypothetical protein ACSFA3_07980 [Variovorax sp. RHLX14]|uniref:hypothetical protein n=1 Tax=Variovorax sp. RHLX14 TaxID=1259731 RepID=UPI003F450794
MAAPSPSRHLLIPFAGRSSPACKAALATLKLPNLKTLLGRLAIDDDDSQAETTLSPPHERALARALGLSAEDGLIPWAAREAQQNGLSRAGSGEPWALLTLCHWQVAIDQVVLDDPDAVGITEAESLALLEAARPFFQEDGIAVRRSGTPGRWLARGELFRTLPTASVDRVAGQSIAEWAPLSDALKPVRKLQNEMQMLLYTQRVNDDRVARGAQPINSFWLSGTGSVSKDFKEAKTQPSVIDTLRKPALADDAAAWAAAWQALDAGPVAELLAACTRGEPVTLTLCGDRAARSFVPRSGGLLGRLKRLLNRTQATTVLEAL